MTQPLRSGTVIAEKYRVERMIGAGGAGMVVAARHVELGQLVAVKLLRFVEQPESECISRCKREAMAAVRIHSEHVVHVHDVGTLDDGTPYIVMEYLEGIDLAERIHRVGALDVSEALEYALQACEALRAVHAAGIVHRDLKPANVYITRRSDGRPLVKLLDFGLSKILPHSSLSRHVPTITRPAEIAGSPGYMPPEQVRGSRDLDERADIWALGTILYEALTGSPAFEGRSINEVLRSVLEETPAPMASLRPEIDEALEAIVSRCLERDPELRFPNVTELAAALETIAPARNVRAPEMEPRHETVEPHLFLADHPTRSDAPVSHREDHRKPNTARPFYAALAVAGAALAALGIGTGRTTRDAPIPAIQASTPSVTATESARPIPPPPPPDTAAIDAGVAPHPTPRRTRPPPPRIVTTAAPTIDAGVVSKMPTDDIPDYGDRK